VILAAWRLHRVHAMAGVLLLDRDGLAGSARNCAALLIETSS